MRSLTEPPGLKISALVQTGVRTPSVQVREHLVAAAHALEQAGGQLIDQAFARREAPSPEIALGRALGAFMQAHPDLPPTHTPTGAEMASIRAQAREALQGAPVPMPPAGSLLTMAMRAASMLQAVSARSAQPATQDEAQTAALVARANEGLSAAHRLLSPAADARQRFVDDLCAKLDGWDLRPVPLEERQVKQGYLELSAANPIRQMMAMIETTRGFEANTRMIQSQDNALGTLISRVLKA